MKYFLGLVLAALPALGQSGGIAPLALFTQFQQPPSPVVVDSIRREAANILAPLGFPFQWWAMDGKDYQAAADLAVITFRGRCTTACLLSSTRTPGALGFTYISDGQVLPFAEVNCDRIRDFLREDLIRTHSTERESVYGRAVGRVLAHELFHVFVRSAAHGARGVAEPAFTQAELLGNEFQLATREFRLLRAGLKQARVQNSHLRSAASPLAGRFIFQESGCASCHGPQGGGTPSAPPLRGALADVKAFAGRLASNVKKMSRQAKAAPIEMGSLDDDEIADIVSFLGGGSD